MLKWFFQVKHGTIATAPDSITLQLGKQDKANVAAFLLAEAGMLLNEPHEHLVISIPGETAAAEAVGYVAKAVGWLFDRLEVELDQDFQNNYLKLTYMNLKPTLDKGERSGQMSTNFPELPESALDLSPAMMVRQLVVALRSFFAHLRAAAIGVVDGDTDIHACDWVSMTFNKAAE